MPFDRFLIAPLKTGLETDLKPWQVPDDAFTTLKNAYVFRGRVRKRFGTQLMGEVNGQVNPFFSRLSINISTTDSSGNISGMLPGSKFKVGQCLSIGNTVFTVVSLGTPADLLRTDGSLSAASLNTTTGAYNITGATPLAMVTFYPAEPVMGLTNYEYGAANNKPSFAFDTQFSYQFLSGYWQRSGNVVWHGTDANFFWACNWTGVIPGSTVMFVTNFNATAGAAPGTNDDPIYSYDGSYDGSSWSAFNPVFLTAGNQVNSAKIIIAFKDRLLLLNTVESNANNTFNTAFTNRLRYSINGSPFAAGAWLEKNQVGYKGAGFIDATTDEQIIGAEFIKDRLIVFFERSTWELVYTGNQVLPFVWQKINTELGSESPFSSVPFDKVILTVAQTGIHACNGANVERIDDKIPDNIWQIRNINSGPLRVAGIRDYYTEMVYWSIPTDNAPPTSPTYPNQVLVYNYKNGSWAYNDDTITCFGYFEQQQGLTWENWVSTWEESTFTWNSGVVAPQFKQVIAGNQQGFVFIVDPETSTNAYVMQVTDADAVDGVVTLTIINHNLDPNDYLMFAYDNGLIGLAGNIFPISTIVDANTITINAATTGVYLGGTFVRRVSNVNITSKQWNPYVEQGRDVYIEKIDFCVDKTTSGQVTVDYFPSSTSLSMLQEGIATGTQLGSGVLETSPYAFVPLEQYQQRLWHPVYLQTDGECIQIKIYMSPEQMTNPAISLSDFELEGMILQCMPTTDRLR